VAGPRKTLGGHATMGAGSGEGGAIGGVADGVSIDGTGTPASPFSVIPGYVQQVGGFTRLVVVGNQQDVAIPVAEANFDFLELLGVVPNNNAAASTLSLQPVVGGVGITANQAAQEFGGAGALTVTSGGGVGAGNISAFAWTLLALGFAPATGATHFRALFLMRRGTARPLWSRYTTLNNAGAITNYSTLEGRWDDAASVVGSMNVHSDRVDGIKSGSVFWYRGIKGT